MEKEGKEIVACSYRGEAGRRRYEQLKDSVRTLRSHIRHPSSSRPSSSSSATSFVPLPSSLSSCPLGVQRVDGGSNANNFVQESAPPAPIQQQLLHIQFQIQQQVGILHCSWTRFYQLFYYLIIFWLRFYGKSCMHAIFWWPNSLPTAFLWDFI